MQKWKLTKTIGNVKIEKHSINYTEKICTVISMFEILKDYHKIQDFNYNGFLEFSKKFAENYDESVVKDVLNILKYPNSSIVFLRNILNFFGVKNELSEYTSGISKCQIPKMEEIYVHAKIVSAEQYMTMTELKGKLRENEK